jgi:hypothetical protein
MGVLLVMVAATAVALTLLWFGARNAITVCVAEIRGGKVVVTRGGIAPRILADVADVVARPPVARARLRILRTGGLAQIELEGDLSAAQRQQVRNVIGSVPLAKLANPRTRR